MQRCKSQRLVSHAGLADGNLCSTEANALRSPLLKLPAEVSNTIYLHAFTGVVVRRWTSFTRKSGAITGATALSLFICRQLHHETSIIFVSQVAFGLTGYRGCHLLVANAVRAMGSQRSNEITSIVMDSKTISYLYENESVELDKRSTELLKILNQHIDSITTSTEANARKSPFLRIPGELRNKINNYTLAGTILTVYPPSILQQRLKQRLSRPWNYKYPHELAGFALRTCWQVHYEASALLFRAAIVDSKAYADTLLNNRLFINFVGRLACDTITSIALSHTMVRHIINPHLVSEEVDVDFTQGAASLLSLQTVWMYEDGPHIDQAITTIAPRIRLGNERLVVYFTDKENVVWGIHV